MNTNWQEALQDIARAETALNRLELLRIEREGLYQGSGLADLDAAIAAIEDRPTVLRSELRRLALDYVAETGDTNIHDLIDYRRTSKAIYDDKEALAWCEEHAEEFVKTKRSLDKRKFNTAVKDGVVEFPGAEMVNDPTVAIKSVAHLLEDKS